MSPMFASNPLIAAAALGLPASLLLIGLLANKVLVEGIESPRVRRLETALAVVIVPLLGVFALIVVDRISGLLSS